MILREYLPNNFPPFRITPCWNLWATRRNMCVQITRPHFLSKKKKIHNHTKLLYFFFFFFDTTELLYFTMHKYSKKTHTNIKKTHNQNEFIPTNE